MKVERIWTWARGGDEWARCQSMYGSEIHGLELSDGISLLHGRLSHSPLDQAMKLSPNYVPAIIREE